MKIAFAFFIGWVASGLFLMWTLGLHKTDNRIWCYVKTVSSIDEVVLSSDQVVRYTRGGIDVMQKCE